MTWLRIAVVNLGVLAAGLALGELALRMVAPLPVPGGIYRDAAGAAVPVAQDSVTLRPRIAVTHVAPEFRKRVTTNALGYRTTANQGDAPDLVFLGDSFTFGHGVADDESFASLYCRAAGRACQNLGRPGTATVEQTEILRHALARGMQPRTVVLVMLAACWFDSAGNDLGDNDRSSLRHRAGAAWTLIGRAVADARAPAPPDVALLKRLQIVLADVEIVKRALLAIAAPLKRGVYRCSSAAQAERVMPATGAALRVLESLAQTHGFRVAVFVIHPLQELDGAHRTTESYLRAVMPESFRAVYTAQHLRPEHYYPYDGHFNAAGHAAMAAVIGRSLDPP